MKLGLILAYLILYVAHTQSQDECRGSVSPADPKCIGDGNAGHTYRPSCLRNANNGMWFYDLTSGFCKKLSYQGCGGNKNRFCSQKACKIKCERSEKLKKI